MRMDFLKKDNSERKNNVESLKKQEEFLRQSIGAYDSTALSTMFKK